MRHRVQNATLGHRGRKRDPLYRIRKLLVSSPERLEGTGVERMLLGVRAGDPDDEVLGAWLAKESVRDVYLATTVTRSAGSSSWTRRSRAAGQTPSARSARSG